LTESANIIPRNCGLFQQNRPAADKYRAGVTARTSCSKVEKSAKIRLGLEAAGSASRSMPEPIENT
jgi:hypothetical protein